MGLSTALLLVTAATYPASYVHGLYTFFILPVGSGVLAVIAWHALAVAWPMTCMESTRSAPAVLLWLGGCVIAMGAAAGTAGILAGGTVSDELRRFLLSCVVGSVLVLFSLLVVLRSGASAAIAVTVILTIISVTLGGDVLAQTSLWLVALPSWPETADTPGRLVIALVAGVGGGLLLAAVAHRRLTRGVLT